MVHEISSRMYKYLLPVYGRSKFELRHNRYFFIGDAYEYQELVERCKYMA